MDDREKLIGLLIHAHRADETSENTLEHLVYMADNLIANGVTIPVHCKDCKHWLKDFAGCTDFVGRCEWANYMVGAVGYCVYGERKDNE